METLAKAIGSFNCLVISTEAGGKGIGSAVTNIFSNGFVISIDAGK